MAPHVLGGGYSYDEYGITAAEWQKYGIEFDYVDDIGQYIVTRSTKERTYVRYINGQKITKTVTPVLGEKAARRAPQFSKR
ncbi:MAG: hypothetical protein J6J83_02225 [Oscillospiraceae bacterium]|nr:hypothetical protein [Oscillospiraceae bacterium]